VPVFSKTLNILLLREQVLLLLKDYESTFIEQVHAYKFFDNASQYLWIVNKDNLRNISLFDAQMPWCRLIFLNSCKKMNLFETLSRDLHDYLAYK